MRAGRASKTAELVCMGRAVAHGTTSIARFDDPTALALLPDDARAIVERFHAGTARGLRAGIERMHRQSQSNVMIARTVAIDDAIRAATSAQLVILGAGLDGRAWRMPELRDVVAFEIDHPDSQRDKRARVATLTQAAREVRFVAVDFTRDSLDEELASAGHDASRPTTWVWEGVVMYLTPADIAATLAVIARRSAAGSRLIVAYHCPSLLLSIIGPIVRWVGEPLRSAQTADGMRALLTEHGFHVVRDEGLPEIAAGLSPELAHAIRMIKHLRIVTADR